MPNLPWSNRTIIQLSILGSALGNQVVAVHHFQCGTVRESALSSDTVARAAALELANDWLTGMKTLWLAAKPLEYSIQMVRAQVLERPGNFRHRLTPSEVNPAPPLVGTGVSGIEDMATAAVIRWRTDIAGKSHRGRTYMGPLPGGWIDLGKVISSGLTPINAYATAVKNMWAVGGTDNNDFALTVYSKPYNEGEYGYVQGTGSARHMYFPPDYAGNATNITDFAVDTTLRTQKRRQLGVGS